MKVLGCLFMLLVASFLAFLVPVLKVFSSFFKLRNKLSENTYNRGFQRDQSAHNEQKPSHNSFEPKIFSKGEGEYVDFEDIKE